MPNNLTFQQIELIFGIRKEDFVRGTDINGNITNWFACLSNGKRFFTHKKILDVAEKEQGNQFSWYNGGWETFVIVISDLKTGYIKDFPHERIYPNECFYNLLLKDHVHIS